ADPIGKLVAVRIGIVEKAAFLDEQAPRVDARRIAAVPAERPLAHGRGQRCDGAPNVIALLRFGELIVLDPAPAMAADIEACPADCRGRRRMALERERAAE